MSDGAELQISQADGVVRLTLNRPGKGNALSRPLVASLLDAVEEAARLQARLLVIEGAGRHFCTGFDLSELDDETDDTLLARFIEIELLLQAVRHAPFTTLAIARGRTMGAGADLFCACTERWTTDDASFAFPGAGFGLVLGTARLAEVVGVQTTQDWVEGGRRIDAAAASAARLATRRIDADAIEQALAEAVMRARRLDPVTQAAIHAAVADAGRPRGDAGDGLDMLRLVRSAIRPGLKARIAAYTAALAKP